MEKTKARTSITIDDDVYEEAKRICAANKVSFSSMVENALRDTLQIGVDKTVNDVRKEQDLPPIDGGDAVLNKVYLR